MGGANLISFTIDGVEYKAKEGMTWGEWIDSEYNTIGAYTNSWDILIDIGSQTKNIYDDKYFSLTPLSTVNKDGIYTTE